MGNAGLRTQTQTDQNLLSGTNSTMGDVGGGRTFHGRDEVRRAVRVGGQNLVEPLQLAITAEVLTGQYAGSQ